jgi:hypothetical protein
MLPILFAWALVGSPAVFAALRNSANHAVPLETLDSGGRGATSTTYSSIGSLGGIAGAAAATSSQAGFGIMRQVDLKAPDITLPSPIIAAATDVGGVAVSFSISATDDLDPAPVILAAPTSGSVFPLGDSVVEVSATDNQGNRATGNFPVKVLSPIADGDGDGLNDAAEFLYAALGFDWQSSQPALVGTLLGNANVAGLFNRAQYDANRTAGQNDVTGNPNPFGLYTPQQVQALNLPAPLIQRNPGTGEFTLTLGIEKSTTLEPGSFTPFPMTTPQVLINGQGKLEFRFTSPDNAAFFRLQAE